MRYAVRVRGARTAMQFRENCLTVIARERSDEAIQTEPRQSRYGLLYVRLENQIRRKL
jgi:hypothetical protein